MINQDVKSFAHWHGNNAVRRTGFPQCSNRQLHRAVNDLKMIRPVVLINEIPFHELNFDGSLTLHCQDSVFRQAEEFFRKRLFQWKYFPADMILPPYYPVEKIMHSTGIGITVDETILAADRNNSIVSHEYHDQLATEEDLLKFHPPVISYDEAGTMQRYQQIEKQLVTFFPSGWLGTILTFPCGMTFPVIAA